MGNVKKTCHLISTRYQLQCSYLCEDYQQMRFYDVKFCSLTKNKERKKIIFM